MDKIRFDGKWLEAGSPLVTADNRGLRYGDGVFETLRVDRGRLPLGSRHFQRLFSSLSLLGFDLPAHFTPEKLETEILELTRKNQCTDLARIRLMVFRGEGGLHEAPPLQTHYAIQAWPLNPSYRELNQNGLTVGLYPEARKSTDRFSNLKSANYLPYILAALFARKQKWNDALVLNTEGRVADATIANLFVRIKGNWITPALSEGVVAGVMRGVLLEQMPQWGWPVSEGLLSPGDLLEADAAFLSNALSGIRWIGELENKRLLPAEAPMIFESLIRTSLL